MIKRELGSVCSRLSSGKSIRAENINPIGAYPVIGGNGLRGYTDSYNFDGECAVIGRQGAACGNVRYHSGKAYMTEHAVVVCANDDNDTRYLSYLLSIQNLGRLSAQSAQPGISVKTLSKQEVCLPPLDEQKRVSHLLGTIDSKINANTKLNDYLLQLCAARYDNARNEVAAEGVERPGVLTDLIDVCYGKDHKMLLDGQYPVYGSGGLMRHVGKYLYEGESVLIPRKGTLNNVMIAHGRFWTVDTMFYSKERVPGAARYAYFMLKRMDLASMNAGSAVPSMTTKILSAIPILMPSEALLSELKAWSDRIFRLIEISSREKERLIELRDRLLPKLMSGEIDVSKIELSTQPNNHLADC